MRVSAACELTPTGSPVTARFMFGDFAFDAAALALSMRGQLVPLGRPTLLVLARLLQAQGAVVSQAELLAIGWPDVAVGEGSLRQVIYELRRTLRAGLGTAGSSLQTVRGEGYRLVLAEAGDGRHGLDVRVRGAVLAEAHERARPSTLVGRGSELFLLREALQATLLGAGKSILLVGPGGVGKTRLAQELVCEARASQAITLRARAEPDRGAPPLWPWSSLIRRCLEAVAPDLRAACESEAADALALLLSPSTVSKSGSNETPESQRFFLFEELVRLFARVASHVPLLLVFDDLHAADELSQALFVRLARETPAIRMLLVATCRPLDDVTAPALTRMLQGLDHHVRPARIHLDNLTVEELDALLSHRDERIARDHVAQVHALTRGNPLFSLEVARWLAYDGTVQALPSSPLELRTVILRRIADRTSSMRAVLSAASVLGGEFSATELLGVMDISSASIAVALDEACAAELVVELAGAAGRYRFAHPLLREAVYFDLPLERRRNLHGRVAAWLEGRGPGVVATRVCELAFHLYSAADEVLASQAAHYLGLAAERAYETTAFTAAVESYERALQMLELARPPDLERELRFRLRYAEALRATGCPPERLHAIFLSVSEQATALDRHELLARAALGYAGQSPERFSLARVPNDLDPVERALLHAALEALDARHPELRTLLLTALSLALVYTLESERCRASIAEAHVLASRLGDPALLARVLTVKVFVEGAPGREHEQHCASNELVALAERHGLQSVLVDALVGRALIHYGRAERELAEADFRRARRIAADLGCPEAHNRASLHELFRAYLSGRLDEFEHLTGQLFQAERDVLRARVMFATRMIGLQYLRHGETRQELALESVIEGTFTRSPGLLCALASLYAERGERGMAERVFDFAAADDFAGLPESPTWLQEVGLLGAAACALDDPERAARVYRRLLPFSERVDVIGWEALPGGPVACALGMLATTLGQLDQAERWFELALALCRKLDAPLYEELAKSEYTRMLIRRGSPDDLAKVRSFARGLCAFGRLHGIGLFQARALRAERAAGRARGTRLLRAGS